MILSPVQPPLVALFFFCVFALFLRFFLAECKGNRLISDFGDNSKGICLIADVVRRIQAIYSDFGRFCKAKKYKKRKTIPKSEKANKHKYFKKKERRTITITKSRKQNMLSLFKKQKKTFLFKKYKFI